MNENTRTLPRYYDVKEYYENGLWKKKAVKNAVKRGWITAEEYAEITSEVYPRMKATVTVTLDGKEVRAIIAKTLGLPITDVKPLRYNFAIEGHSAEEVAAKIKAAVGDVT